MFLVRNLVFLSLILYTSMYAASSGNFHGNTTLENATYTTLATHGSSTLTKITAKEITTHGSTSGKDITTDSIQTHGNSNFQKINATNVITHGRSTFFQGKIEKLHTHGSTELQHLGIKQLTSHGKLNMTDCTTNTLEASGTCELNHTTIVNTCTFTSYSVTIQDSIINCSIIFCKPHSISTNSFCSLPVIRWFCSSSEDKPEILKLKGNTKITGNITFESGKGEVYVDRNVTLQGKIIGAQVIRN